MLGWLIGWLAGSFVDRPPRGVVYGVPPKVELAYHDLGATIDLTQLDQTQRERVTGGAPCMNIRWLRQPIRWREIEKSPGQFDWLRLDLPLIDAYGRRLKILAVLQNSPDWARDAHAPVSPALSRAEGTPPKDWRAFGAFARAVAEHYQGQIDAYQIWDEPNIAAGWGGKYPSATEYLALLREAAINIRAADPNAKIISAALAPTTENGPLNLNEPEFLRQLYRVGAQPFFDAVGAEPFGFWTGPDDRRVDVSVLNFSRLILLREVMEANGDGDKAIWATSFGWSIAGRGDPAYGGDEQQVQGTRTINAINRAQNEWAWLGPLMFTRWWSFGANDPRGGFAIESSNGLPGLFTGMGKGCANMRVAPIGRYAADDWSAIYPPNWRVAPDGADAPQNDSSPLTIGFHGTRFDLSVRRGAYEGFLFVTVDGAPANALPRDEQGRSYVVLYDPLGQTADVTLARGLADQQHFVEIVPQGGWGQWAIAGWVVSRERGDSPWQWLGALVGALFGGALSVVVGRMANGERRQILAPLVRLQSSAIVHSSLAVRISSLLIFAAGIALYLSPSVLLSWALIALLAVLIMWRRDVGLALVAFAIPFYLQPKSLGIGSYAVVEIVLLLCALSFALRQIARWLQTNDERRTTRGLSSFAFRLSPFDWLVLVWLLAGVVGVLVAENFGVANRELRVVFIEPALYYLLIRASPINVRLLADAFLAGATLLSTKALADWLTHSNLITAEGVLRVRSVYFSPNNLALYLDRAAPLALSLALFGKSRRVLYAIAFALMLVALYLTFAKGAWLLALPAALLFIGLMRGRRVLFGALVALAALAISLLPVLGTERLRSLFDLTAGTSFIRVQLWQSTIAMIRDHPLFGVGLDNFLYQYRTRYILPSAFAEAGLSHPHNVLLDLWTRLGLLGVALLLALLFVFWREALRLYRRQIDGDARALTLGVMAAMLAALAHGIIDNSFFLVDLAFVLMLMLAIIHVQTREHPDV